ncbi:hypothetical protein [Cellulomonas sp. NS3]|uniref:hypothetical protein n=1 Tax=Cellulomonas sp. NS3 TaxID=2973977 RepID=UPI002163BB54|nr:hypothetical protein [Cellulomonas sp. NS3]
MEVLALADPSGRQAQLLEALRRSLRVHGLALRAASHDELAREARVEQTGLDARVLPDRPLLWLSPGATGRGRTPEDRFVAYENYSAARAVALLSRAPVLNRPTVVAPCGTLPDNRAMAVRRAGSVLGVPQRGEVFTSRAEDADGLTEVLDFATGRTAWRVPEDAAGPFRVRRGISTARAVAVRVVGSTTVSPRPVPRLLAELSIRVAALFSLDLASVWWTGTSAEPYLSRIDGWHWDVSLAADLLPVAAAVADWTVDRLAEGAA